MARSSTKCPTCPEGYNNRVSACDANGNWNNQGDCLKCEHCGALEVDGKWTKKCQGCGKEVEKLVGLFVPHNCEDCQKAVVEKERKAGHVCGFCHQVFANCCC